jgi:hypothetical protein
MASNSRSLKLSLNGQQEVQLALTNKAWRNEDLLVTVGVQIATVKNFRAGKAVDRKNFVKFCQALGLDWATVAEPESPPALQSEEAKPLGKGRSTTAENLQQNSNESQGIQVQGSETTIVGQTVNVYNGSESQSSGKDANTEFGAIDEEKIRQHCREKILHNYSKIRLLSGQEIGVDQLYVDVWLLDRQPRTFQRSASKMLETFDLRNDRLGLGDRIKRDPGFDIACKETRLLILGKPGSGKTTFLKHLALAWYQGNFQTDLIAILIELKWVKDNQWSIFGAIQDALGLENINKSNALLKQGKLLILLDGFDEAATEDIRKNIYSQFVEASQANHKNRLILTCRTQIIKEFPTNFVAVEVADFNLDQIEQFVLNWFQADKLSLPEALHQWKDFQECVAENSALMELTVTPVLLSLICLIFQDEGTMPTSKTSLYQKGIYLLLSRWDEDKEIRIREVGNKIYQDLSIKEKENLLIEIAARKFEDPKNFVLFEQEEIESQIVELLKLSNFNDGIAVLKSIEAQHGLLIERASGLWSFSHLTFQEYFTIKWLNSLSREELIKKITNSNWQNIIKGLVKSQYPADQLLKLVKMAIDFSIVDDLELQRYLTWVLHKSISVRASHRVAVIRSFYFDLHVTHTLSLYFDCIMDPGHHLAKTFAREICSEMALDLDLSHMLHNPINLDIMLKRVISYNIDNEFMGRLRQLKSSLPSYFPSNWEFQDWMRSAGGMWLNELRHVMREYRDIGYDWVFNDRSKIQMYYEANKFLVELVTIENAASPEARQEIEDNLLLPIAELKRRLPDQYGGIDEG